MPQDSSPKRQPTAALWYTLVGPIVLSLFVLILASFIAVSQIGAGYGVLAFVLGLIATLAILSYPILHYYLFTYEFSGDALTVRSGIIFRQYETIGFSKVQVIDNERGPLLMIFGLTMVRIWTNSPDQFNVSFDEGRGFTHAEPDALLILGKNEAEEIKSQMTKPR